MPTFFATNPEDEEALREADGTTIMPRVDYFNAYRMGPQPFNPENKLSEFNTGSPRFKSVEELEGRIKDYFENALKRGQPLTISGMANSIGVNRKTFLEYQDWYKHSKDPLDLALGIKINRIISSALAICEQYAEEKLFDGRMKPQAIIFQMVNNFGWRNKLEVEANNHAEELSEIREAYRKLTEKQKLEAALPALEVSKAESVDNSGDMGTGG